MYFCHLPIFVDVNEHAEIHAESRGFRSLTKSSDFFSLTFECSPTAHPYHPKKLDYEIIRL